MWKVVEILITDLQMAKNLENSLNELRGEGYDIHSIHTTFSSVIVVASKSIPAITGSYGAVEGPYA